MDRKKHPGRLLRCTELSVADVYFAHERGTYLSLYALTLVGSNFFTPVCQRPTIFLAAAFTFMFFFMEETNYDRKSVGVVEGSPVEIQTPLSDPEKQGTVATTPLNTGYHTKTFWLKDKPRQQLMHMHIKQ